MSDNICVFLPRFEREDSFNIINLVYETRCPCSCELSSVATYRMAIVTEGKGRLRDKNGSREIKPADLIMISPAVDHAIENMGGLKYIYISFLGVRANALWDDYRIGSSPAVYSDCGEMIGIFQAAFSRHGENVNLSCEAAVLYAFSLVGDGMFVGTELKKDDSAAHRVKRYLDENFTDSELKLERAAKSLNYHPKYISSVFKSTFGMGVNDYIKVLRMQYSCTLMEQGITSVKNLAALCGYEDPVYFARVFKGHTGSSPRDYMKEKNARQS